MPNLVRVTEMAMEIIEGHMAAMLDELAQQAEDADQQPQRQKAAAYDAVRQADPAQYAQLRAEFDATYGPEEWGYQETLGLRREER